MFGRQFAQLSNGFIVYGARFFGCFVALAGVLQIGINAAQSFGRFGGHVFRAEGRLGFVAAQISELAQPFALLLPAHPQHCGNRGQQQNQ